MYGSLKIGGVEFFSGGHLADHIKKNRDWVEGLGGEEYDKVKGWWDNNYKNYLLNKEDFPISYYKPLLPHAKLLYGLNDKGEMPRMLFMEGANKCLTYKTLIETPHGEVSIGELYERGKAFDVYAWDGERKVVARASAPFKKPGLHSCYRLTSKDGKVIEAADGHRLLTSHGWSSVEQLVSFGHSLRVSSLGNSRLARVLNDLHLKEKESGFRFGCQESPCYGDEQLRFSLNNDQDVLPLSGGVRRLVWILCNLDGQGRKHTNIAQVLYDHPSSLYGLGRPVGRFFEFLSQGVCTILKFVALTYRGSLQLSTVGVFEPQLVPEVVFRTCDTQYDRLAFDLPPFLIGDNNNIAHKPIGVKSVFDFEVKKYHNYFAGGLVNHNTGKTTNAVAWQIGMACSQYPWLDPKNLDGVSLPNFDYDHNWKLHRKIIEYCGFRNYKELSDQFFDLRKILGKRYKVPNINIAIGETYTESVEKDLVPKYLGGGGVKGLIPACWLPKAKKNQQGVVSKITLGAGPGKGSVFHFRSYKSAADEFEGIDATGSILFNEPPPEDIVKAVLRGAMPTDTRAMFAYTALKQPWLYREYIYKASRWLI